jgi:A/G-specific adenine glycosylase
VIARRTVVEEDAAALRRALLRWYRRNRRDLPWRRTKDPWAVWVSEAMLQQTQVATVIPYYARFLAAFPTVASLAAAPDDRVLAVWSGLGYYRRARALHAGARAVVERFGGRIPSDALTLRSLPGIGRYTAGALLSIAFGRGEAALDGNVRRVLSRLLALNGRGAREERVLWEKAEALVRKARSPGEVNQALMEVGALVCLPRAPRCRACPVALRCAGRSTGRPEDYPAPAPRRPVARVRVAAALVEDRGRLLLERKGSGGPFRGEWDLPAIEVAASGNGASRLRKVLRERHGLDLRTEGVVARVRHAILDRRLEIEVIRCRAVPARQPAGNRARFVAAGSLDEVPVSGATRKILGAARLAPSGTAQERSHGGIHRSSDSARRRSDSGSGSSGRSKR